MRLDFIVGSAILVGFVYLFPISSFMGVGASIADMASICQSSKSLGPFSSQIMAGFTCRYNTWYYICMGAAALGFIYGIFAKGKRSY
jgi:hypothetical protein